VDHGGLGLAHITLDTITAAGEIRNLRELQHRHRESDAKVHRGRITKQGNPLVRWAAVEAVQGLGQRAGAIGIARVRIGERRGANIGKVAAARKLLTLVYRSRLFPMSVPGIRYSPRMALAIFAPEVSTVQSSPRGALGNRPSSQCADMPMTVRCRAGASSQPVSVGRSIRG
jgi:hypothetical protein